MILSIEIATRILKKSIEKGKQDANYYMDYVKLHKIMYLGQCYMLYKYGINLFDEYIIARKEGPYIDGLDAITAVFGFEDIKSIDGLEKHTYIDMIIPALRGETCDLMVNIFGKYSTEEIVKLSKNTLAYQESYVHEKNNIISSKDLMIKTGEILFNVNEKELEEQRAKIKKIGIRKTNVDMSRFG